MDFDKILAADRLKPVLGGELKNTINVIVTLNKKFNHISQANESLQFQKKAPYTQIRIST